MFFRGYGFVFTGKFRFGSRKKCEQAVSALGGVFVDDDRIPAHVDFVVIGALGSRDWVHGDYGSKVFNAVMRRKLFGKPAIAQEAIWVSALEASGHVPVPPRGARKPTTG